MPYTPSVQQLATTFVYNPELGTITPIGQTKAVQISPRTRGSWVGFSYAGQQYNARSVAIALHTGVWPERYEYKFMGEQPTDLRWSNFCRRVDGDNRRCLTCGKMLPADKFYIKTAGGKGTHSSYCKPCYGTRQKHHDYHSRLIARYGVTYQDYVDQLELQGGGCAICGATENVAGRRLAVDHCHMTGVARAILCNRCNGGLGMFDDDPRRLLEAARYLLRHKRV